MSLLEKVDTNHGDLAFKAVKEPVWMICLPLSSLEYLDIELELQVKS
jgi:hypothetical protein